MTEIQAASQQLTLRELLQAFEKIPGGYVYMGCASHQVCFPLKKGGELRVMWDDDDVLTIDLYDGALPPGISGPAFPTGEEKVLCKP